VMDAYAAAYSGDEIVVMPGVYEESFVFDLAKEVVIYPDVSAGGVVTFGIRSSSCGTQEAVLIHDSSSLTTVSGIEVDTKDCTRVAHVMKGTLQLSEVSLPALGTTKTPVGVASDKGGSVFVEGDGRVHLEQIVWTHSPLDSSGMPRLVEGGHVYSRSTAFTTVTVVNSVLSNAEANLGGAVSVGGGWFFLSSTLMSGNTAELGGAVHMSGTAYGVFSLMTFDGNDASLSGGAVHLADFSLIQALGANTWLNNTASGAGADGGAISMGDYTSLSIGQGDFIGNAADGDGGAIYKSGEFSLAMDVSEVSFSGNSAGGNGGAIAVTGLQALQVPEFRQNTFCGNTALAGGGLYSENSYVEVTNNIFSENVATSGGAVYSSGLSSKVFHNHFVGNSGTFGAAVKIGGDSNSVVNNLFAMNRSGVAIDNGLFTQTMSYNLFFSNSGGDFTLFPVDFSNMTFSDPLLYLFTEDGDCHNDDLTYPLTSPLVDAGRLDFADPDGSRADIGAFGGPNALDRDLDGDGVFLATDCDDQDASVFPGAIELVADGVDQNCDGMEDCYLDVDLDGDGGVDAIVISADVLDCSGAGVAPTSQDCDDFDALVYSGAVELPADGVDSDCDGSETCFVDLDGDGFGTFSELTTISLDCTSPGASAWSSDCNDILASAYPGATEVAGNGIDEDCDGLESCFVDSDSDGFGGRTLGTLSDLTCNSGGYSANSLDCDDKAFSTFPGALEVIADGVDQNCDGVELCFEDLDTDGFGSTSTLESVNETCDPDGVAWNSLES